MSQLIKITLHDNYRNVVQLNPKNMPDNIIYLNNLSGYITEESLNARNYLTNVPSTYITEQTLNNKGYLTNIPDEYVTNEQLANMNYLTTIPENYITEQILNNKGYLTGIPSNYLTDQDINRAIEEIDNTDSGSCILSFNDSDKFNIIATRSFTIEVTDLTIFGQFLLARIDNTGGYTITFNNTAIISSAGIYNVIFGTGNVMLGNPAKQSTKQT